MSCNRFSTCEGAHVFGESGRDQSIAALSGRIHEQGPVVRLATGADQHPCNRNLGNPMEDHAASLAALSVPASRIRIWALIGSMSQPFGQVGTPISTNTRAK